MLNCVGNCALKSCELNPQMARVLNVHSAAAVADCARAFGCRLVHLSSDLVYSGVGAGNYVETDPVDPVTVYGKSMAEAHKGLAITNADFDNLVKDLEKALEKNKVGKTEKDELLALLAPLKKDIVENPQ